MVKLEVKGGRVWIDIGNWAQNRAAIQEYSGGLIVDDAGKPVAAVPPEDFANKDSELLACDVECRLAGINGFYMEIDIPGLDQFIRR